MLFTIAPSSPSRLRLWIDNWSASHQLVFLTLLRLFKYLVIIVCLHWSWKASMGSVQLRIHFFVYILWHSSVLLKETVILLFLSSPVASKHSAFPLIEVSASELSAILKKFVSKEATSEAALWNCVVSQAVFVWRHSVQLEISREEKNLNWLTWHLSQGQQNLFFQAITLFHSLVSFRSLEHVWLKVTQNGS